MSNANANDNAAEYYDIIYEDYEADKYLTEREIKFTESLIHPTSRILDVGCGTGRHLIPLAEKSYDILGIDLSKGMLEQLLKKYPKAKVALKNIYTDEISGNYDLIMIMWNALCEICYTKDDLQKLLRVLKKLLNSNGKILIDMLYDESEGITFGLNFNYDRTKDNNKYTVTWTVKDFDLNTNTTICEEKVEILDLNTNETQIIRSDIKQKWWRESDIRELAGEISLNVDLKTIEGSRHKYYLLS